jgi:hypothetical protein
VKIKKTQLSDITYFQTKVWTVRQWVCELYLACSC